MVSSFICDRWLTHELVTFMGLTDSLECNFSSNDQRSVTAVGLDLYSEPAKRGEPSPFCVGAGLVANL